MPEEEKQDPARPRGVALKASEWERLEVIAGEFGVTTHAVAVWAVRDFLRRWDAGEIKTVSRKTLPGL